MPLGYFAAMAIATLVGLSLGALGSGGSIITTPVLVYVAHVPPENAIGMSLLIVGTTSLVGALLHFRRQNVAIKPALLFVLTGTPGAFLGSTGTHLLSRRALMLLFASVMFVVGTIMWRGTPHLRRATSPSVWPSLIAGFAVGLLTGFMGVGGGFLIVPALVFFAGLDSHRAAGTALAVIAVNTATGLAGQLRFVRLDWTLLAGFLLFAVGGMIIGSTVAQRLSELRLRRIFAAAVLVLAVGIGLQNLLL